MNFNIQDLFSCYIVNVTDRIFSLFILNSHLSIFMFDLILIFTKIQCEHFQRLFKKKTEFSNISFDLVIFQAPLSFIVLFKYLELLMNSLLCSCKLLRVRPRFFDQVGHETMYASCHHQIYQNYEHSR